MDSLTVLTLNSLHVFDSYLPSYSRPWLEKDISIPNTEGKPKF